MQKPAMRSGRVWPKSGAPKQPTIGELKGLVRVWTYEALEEMEDWVGSLIDEMEHPLVLDLENMHYHERRIVAEIYMMAQVEARLRKAEEEAELMVDIYGTEKATELRRIEEEAELRVESARNHAYHKALSEGTKDREALAMAKSNPDVIRLHKEFLRARYESGTWKTREEYTQMLDDLLELRCQRRCVKALVDALRCKLSTMPGMRGEYNAIVKG